MSHVAAEVVKALGDELPEGTVKTDEDIVASYSVDRAMYAPVGKALAVVFPRKTAHVQQVMRVASKYSVPVVPQGARSGLSGAATALDGSILLNLEKMRDVLEIDAPNRIVVTQPGIFNAELSRKVAEHGLFYPPDPSSWEFCSIGGNVSTNSGGLCCVKYGVTTDYVLGLEVVMADGEILRTGRRTVKGVAGYDLTKLFVGSEGTLGVITEITLMLRPETEVPRTVAGVFDSAPAAADAVSAVVTSGMVPSLLEFMDRVTLQVVNDEFNMGMPDGAAALLIGQSDAGGERALAEIAALAEIFATHGAIEVAIAEDAAEGELLLAGRRQALTAMEKLGTLMIDDVCVPRTRLAELIAQIEQVSSDCGLIIGVVGHAGDGNFHPNVVFDGQDPDQVKAAQKAFDDIMVIALELGGTITGEHGIGLLKMELLERELGPRSIEVHRAIKKALDPQGILNPNKIFTL